MENRVIYLEAKKEPSPTRPGNGSKVAPYPSSTRKKRRSIIYRIVRFVKRWRRLFGLVLLLIAICFAMTKLAGAIASHSKTEATEAPEVPSYTTGTVYIFADGEGHPIDIEAMTNAWAAEAGFEKRYTLTDEERLIVCQVVQAEAGGEPFAGKVAVAQCILRACEDDEIRPDVAVRKYGYCKSRPEPSQETLDAVQAVFDFGHVATVEPIKYFYAPGRTASSWHETQDYVMTINNHRFFKEPKE